MDPLEVLRISTVVDVMILLFPLSPFGSAKNFYCCRFISASTRPFPLEVLRISTVVDVTLIGYGSTPLEVLRISTVVDKKYKKNIKKPLEVLRISTVVDH